MTGVAALQSYLENRLANLHNGGGSFATLDRDAPFQLSVQKQHQCKRMLAKEWGNDLGPPLPVGRLCIDYDSKQKRQRGSVQIPETMDSFFFPPLVLTALYASPRESIRTMVCLVFHPPLTWQ